MPRQYFDLDSNLPRITKRVHGPCLADIRSALLAWPATDHPVSRACWVWTGAMTNTPVIRRAGKLTTVPRYLLELVAGEPLGMTWRVYAKCPNPACINPFHYELKPFYINRFDVPDPLPKRLQGVKLGPADSDDVLDLAADMADRDIDTYELARGIFDPLSVYTLEEINAAYDLHASRHGLKARPTTTN